ncbi:MAG: D-glycero-alpha-D-manno-heptose-1,7-bisphosphate 7-phosphatase [Candidatus Aminicenantia bacterium]
MKKIAVFLDRDGTINEDVGYPSNFEQIKIFPFSFEAIRKINQAGLLAIVITNQSGIGRGLLTEENLKDIHQKMKEVFFQKKAFFDAIYYCPHYYNPEKSNQECTCRKPLPGMALQAAKKFNIDLSRSYMIGDKVEDIVFGQNIGAKAILVLTGYGKVSLQKLKERKVESFYVAENLLEAVNWLLKDVPL